MDLKELAAYQREFDKRHGWDWSNLNNVEKIDALNYLAVALAGKLGSSAISSRKSPEGLNL